MKLLEQFDGDRPIIGMVHLPALPGSPGFDGDRDAIRSRALDDARTLEAGGIDGIILENFGDAPFYPETVPTHVVAEMTAHTNAVTDAVDVPVGVNVLRNDAEAAVSIAAATGASFVRVNVHIGAAATDQGVLEGKAHETIRLREQIDADVGILADVHVKHATPVGETSIEQVALEATERGLADGVIVSGAGTGVETQLEDIERVSDTLGELEDPVPVFVGSGVTAETISDCFEEGSSGVIVGTALKEGKVTTNRVSREQVETIVETGRDPQ
ncbi:BtpA/SgcQ family protein [Halostagnicola bangensis]